MPLPFRRRLFAVWTAALVVSLAPEALGQGRGEASVTGTVTDAETAEPLAGANLYAPALQTGTATDLDGRFRLALPAGTDTVTVRVSFVGYAARTLRLRAGSRVDVALAPEAGLDEVAVESSRDGDGVRSTQMSTVTLDAAEVTALPVLLGELDVLKTIQLLPGVQSGAEGSTGLYVRGGGPDQNLVLLDGAPVYNPSHVLGFLSVFNTEAVRDVRLVTGGFPARYGGRLSSVVDVRLRDGDRDSVRTAGSVGVVASALTVEGPLPGAASFIVSGRRTYIDVLAAPFLARQAPDQSLTAYFYDLNARLSADLGPRDRVSASGYLGDDVYGTGSDLTFRSGTTTYRERTESAAAWGNVAATARWDHDFSPRASLSAALMLTRYRLSTTTRLSQRRTADSLAAPLLDQTQEAVYASGISDRIARADLFVQPHPAHAVRAGVSVARHAFNPGVGVLSYQLTAAAPETRSLTPSTFGFTTWETDAYVEDDAEITPWLQVNAGLHASALATGGRTYTSLQPRLAARALVRPGLSVKGSFSTMEQYLHLLTNTGVNLPTDLWLSATDRIPPQRAWQAAVGVAAESGAWEATAEAYVKRMRNVIEYRPGASFISPGQSWEDKVEVGRGRASGVELFLRRRTGRTTGWVGYTVSWSTRQFDALEGGVAFPYRYDRRHDVSVVLAHQLSRRLTLGATWVYGTGQAVTLATARFYENGLLDPGQLQRLDPRSTAPLALPELRQYGPRGGYRMAPYHRLDLALSWEVGGVPFVRGSEGTLVVGATNVYNRHNPYFLFSAQDASGSRAYRQASLLPVLPSLAYRFRF